MRPETALARWLTEELPRRGYPLGPRAGGIARFAADTGLSPATASRTVNGKQEPSTDTLRRIGKLWGIPFTEMLEFAGLIEPEERAAHEAKADHPSRSLPQIRPDDWRVDNPPDDLWLGLNWDDLDYAERCVWHIPNTSREIRFRLFKALQMERGFEVQAEMERRGIDRDANHRHINGANEA